MNPIGIGFGAVISPQQKRYAAKTYCNPHRNQLKNHIVNRYCRGGFSSLKSLDENAYPPILDCVPSDAPREYLERDLYYLKTYDEFNNYYHKTTTSYRSSNSDGYSSQESTYGYQIWLR